MVTLRFTWGSRLFKGGGGDTDSILLIPTEGATLPGTTRVTP